MEKTTPNDASPDNDASWELEQLQARCASLAARAERVDHDMRTPIGAMMAALTLLQAAPNNPTLRAETLAVMSRQLQRMTGLTETLRLLAQELGRAAADPAAAADQDRPS